MTDFLRKKHRLREINLNNEMIGIAKNYSIYLKITAIDMKIELRHK